MASPGARPDIGVRGVTVRTVDLMSDERFQPTLPEFIVQGTGKAHRNVVYAHFEMRNYRRNRGATGRVT